MTLTEIREKHKDTIERGALPMFSSVCTFCAHYQSGQKCAAFPDRIPKQIWLGDDEHKNPYPGDNGIRFAPVQIKRAA
jgi:hypothetical protein